VKWKFLIGPLIGGACGAIATLVLVSAIRSLDSSQQAAFVSSLTPQQLVEYAKAEAEANRLIGESLSPELISYHLIKQWDGCGPRVLTTLGEPAGLTPYAAPAKPTEPAQDSLASRGTVDD
jgi:hypothetical protein